MATFISHSPEATEALGESWGREARAGLVIGLNGDLGAGKTRLVKGLARGLGFPGRVHSPTFALLNIYEGGRLPLFHLDLYRLANPEQIMSAGLESYLTPDGVAVVEWADRWYGEDARSFRASGTVHLRWVQLESLNGDERRITYEDFSR